MVEISKSDEVVDMVFDLLGGNVGKVLDWLYGYNASLQAVPVELMKAGKIDSVHEYLLYMKQGPY